MSDDDLTPAERAEIERVHGVLADPAVSADPLSSLAPEFSSAASSASRASEFSHITLAAQPKVTRSARRFEFQTSSRTSSAKERSRLLLFRSTRSCWPRTTRKKPRVWPMPSLPSSRS